MLDAWRDISARRRFNAIVWSTAGVTAGVLVCVVMAVVIVNALDRGEFVMNESEAPFFDAYRGMTVREAYWSFMRDFVISAEWNLCVLVAMLTGSLAVIRCKGRHVPLRTVMVWVVQLVHLWLIYSYVFAVAFSEF